MWNLLQDELGGGVWPRLLVALVDTGAKGLILMAAAGLAAAAMRRNAAAARHLVWMLALCGLLLLPVVSVMMPKWTLPILPALEAPATQEIAEALAPTPAAQPYPVNFVPPPTDALPPTPLNTTPMPAPQPAPSVPLNATPTTPAQNPLNAPAWILALWLTGALLSLAPFAAGVVAVARMRRRAEAFSEGDLQALASALGRTLGLKRPARLLCGPAGSMPMATGFLRPAVFLPDDALAWTEEKRRVVLLHELAHVKRRDCLAHAIARTAVALHWFNPLAWLALRQLRIEREHACDDLVLAAGERPSAYAENLLEIARTLRAGSVVSAAAITMAQKSQLEGRLLAVLDAARNRGLVTRKFAVICIATVSVVVGVLGAVAVTREIATTSDLLAIAKPVKKTTLESFFGGWRNLPFELSDGDAEAIAQCLELSQRYKTEIGVDRFSIPEVRESLDALLSKQPDFFYVEHLLGTWHQMNGNTALAEDYFLRSYRHAPVVLIQRYEHSDGSPIVGAAIRQFEIECNRVQGGSLDPSLNLKYFALTTDTEGCVYLPVYDTVYRVSTRSFPEGLDVSYPKLGWFVGRGKAAMLPVAVLKDSGNDPSTANANSNSPIPDYLRGSWTADGKKVTINGVSLSLPLSLEFDAGGAIVGRLGDVSISDARIVSWTTGDSLEHDQDFDHKIEGHLKGLLDDTLYAGPVLIGLIDQDDHWLARPFIMDPSGGSQMVFGLSHYMMERSQTLRFAGGLVATIVAVGDSHGANPHTFWHPDGTPIGAEPLEFESILSVLHPSKDEVEREFLLRILPQPGGPAATDISARWRILAPSRSGSGGQNVQDNVRYIKAAMSISQNLTSADLELGIAADPWVAVVEAGFAMTSTIGEYSLAVGKPYEQEGELTITVSHNVPFEKDCRLVAFDQTGVAHPLVSRGTYSADQFTQAHYSLESLSPENIQRFELQVREFEWKKFEGIAVNPDDRDAATKISNEPVLQPNPGNDHQNSSVGVAGTSSETLPPPVNLAVHAYQQVGEPLAFKATVENWPHTTDEIPVMLRCDGKEYDLGEKLELTATSSRIYVVNDPAPPRDGPQLNVGKHRASLIFRNVTVHPKPNGEADSSTTLATFDKIESNEVEFEVVNAIPAGYFQPKNSDQWDMILRNMFKSVSYQVSGDGAHHLVVKWWERLPFNLAFHVAIEEAGSNKIHLLGNMSIPGTAEQTGGDDGGEPTWSIINPATKKILPSLAGKQVSLILTPSIDAAMSDPSIVTYYGRSFTTPWMEFLEDPSPEVEQNNGPSSSRDELPAKAVHELEKAAGAAEVPADFPPSTLEIHEQPPGSGRPVKYPFLAEDGKADGVQGIPKTDISWKYRGKDQDGWHFTFTRTPPLEGDTASQIQRDFTFQPDPYGNHTVFADDGVWIGVVETNRTRSIPATLPVRLSAQHHYAIGDPIYIEVAPGDYPHGVQVGFCIIRCDGKEYKQNIAPNAPFSPLLRLDPAPDAPWNLPGKHRLTAVLNLLPSLPLTGDLDLIEFTNFEEVESNEIEIEVLPAIPEGYFQAAYEEGWEEILRGELRGLQYHHNPAADQISLRFDWRGGWNAALPFNLAFDVAVQRESEETATPIGTLTAPMNGLARASHFQANESARELLSGLEGQRVRLTLTPSAAAASMNPSIRAYYGREFTTAWMRLKPEPFRIAAGFSPERRALGADGSPNSALNIDEIGVLCQPVLKGGRIMPAPGSETRLLPLPDALLVSDAAAMLRKDPDRLSTSKLNEINVKPDALNYIAVLSAKGETWLMLVDTDIAGDRQVYFWPTLALEQDNVIGDAGDISNSENIIAAEGEDALPAWGEVHQGLQAALRFLPEKAAYALGETVGVEVLVRNSSPKTIEFVTSKWRQDDQWTVLNATDKKLEPEQEQYSAPRGFLRVRLDPGQSATLECASIALLSKGDATDIEYPVATRFTTEVGIHSVQIDINLPGGYSSKGPGVPKPDDWTGTLTTGVQSITLVAGEVSKAASPSLQVRWVATEPGPETTTKVRWRDGDSKRANEPNELQVENEVLLNAQDVENVRVAPGYASGLFELRIKLSEDASKRWANLTQINIGRKMAIIINDEIVNAPTLNGAIADGNIALSGDFSELQAQELAAAIRAANPALTRAPKPDEGEATLDPEAEGTEADAVTQASPAEDAADVSSANSNDSPYSIFNHDYFSTLLEAPNLLTRIAGDAITPPAADTSWGPVVNGLQAAVRFIPEKNTYALGEAIGMEYLVRNAGPVHVEFLTSKWRNGDQCVVTDDQGKKRVGGTSQGTGLNPVRRVKLAPGEVAAIESASFTIMPEASGRSPLHPVATWARSHAGIHKVQFRIHFPDRCSMSGESAPRPDDWTGTLMTGERTIEFVDDPELFRAHSVFQIRMVAPKPGDKGAKAFPWEASNRPPGEVDKLWLLDEVLVGEGDLAAVVAVPGASPHQYAIEIRLNERASERLALATGENIGHRMACMYQEMVYAAPTLNGPVGDGKLVVGGKFSKDVAESIVSEIRAANALDMKAPFMQTSAETTLGPEVEVTVRHSGENCMIDFDTGKLFTPPEFKGTEDAFAWCVKNGIDAGGGNQAEVRGLIGMDLVLNPEANGVWDDAATNGALSHDAFKYGTPGNPVYLSAKGDLPATWTFKTREGGLGIVQIIGFADDEPRGVRIRYRMLKSDKD